ncbi:hypothetical protein [Campylobacter concisus]|uniref:hypothetical protein n=1 Tax=Campylobacter concisus TaxID=199 RepID=UPI00122CA02F|nr:hypothetical protein [Campylobacter concisus]
MVVWISVFISISGIFIKINFNRSRSLTTLSEAGLSVSIVADKNDNGTISRDESGSKISKVYVSIPGSVVAGDKIDVKITNPDGSTATNHYEVIGKDVSGKTTLKNIADPMIRLH